MGLFSPPTISAPPPPPPPPPAANPPSYASGATLASLARRNQAKPMGGTYLTTGQAKEAITTAAQGLGVTK